jgi:hypothetical protein
VAQWLAQATHNRLVAGSTPAGPTFFPPNILFAAPIQGMVFDSSRAYIFHHFFFLPERQINISPLKSPSQYRSTKIPPADLLRTVLLTGTMKEQKYAKTRY